MQRSEERQLCKTTGKENRALPTPPARLHVVGKGRVDGPRELLKTQRLLSTSAFGWRGQQANVKLLNSEEGLRTSVGFCSPSLLQLIRPSAESVPADPRHVCDTSSSFQGQSALGEWY